jgi:hypothetical protein
MAVTPPKKGRGWDLANTNIQEWIKLFQGVGVMKVYISYTELTSDKEMERDLSEWRRDVHILYECD